MKATAHRSENRGVAAVPQARTARDEVFGYACRRCSRCCRDKRIQVNPYEIARLARNRGMDSAQFRARHTEGGNGTHLRRDASGACEFLGADGCGVHADRPLVCRLYPLGRHVGADGNERFSRFVLPEESAGEYTRDGDIAAWLHAQGAEPFMRAADDYFLWLCRAQERFSGLEETPSPAPDEEAVLDMDIAIRRHAAAHGVAEPDDIEERRVLHLRILDAFLATPA